MTTGVNAPERAIYHEWIDKFKGYLKSGDSVLDIGCFPRHDYHSTMREFKYQTIDPNLDHHPDIVGEIGLESLYLPYDGLMCHGVHSECQNPFSLTGGAIKCLKSGGIGLFGVVLLGYPTYQGEKWRFTEAGVNSLLSGLEVLEKRIVHREQPSFWFGIVRKPQKQ